MLRESTNSLSTVERSLSDLDARISSLSVRLDNMEVQRLHIKEDITRKGFWRSIGLELNTEILHPDGFEKKSRNEEESYSNRLVSHSKPPSNQYSSNHTMNTVPTLPQSSSSDNPEDPLSASKSVAYIQSQRIRLRSDSSLSAPADPENLSRLQKEFIDVNDFNEFHRSILPSSSHPGIAQRAERESYIHSSPLRTSHSEQVDRSAGSDRADDLELDDGLDSLHPRTDLALQYRSTRKSNNVVGINHLGIEVSSSSHTSALEVQPPLSPDLLQSLNEVLFILSLFLFLGAGDREIVPFPFCSSCLTCFLFPSLVLLRILFSSLMRSRSSIFVESFDCLEELSLETSVERR